MGRRLLFSVSVKDCRVDTFSAGGKGGQNQNRRSTGVRIVHVPSGAVGESREHREQLQNKRAAFRRMGESGMFQAWAKMRAAEVAGQPSVDERVDAAMSEDNIITEVRGNDGKWGRVPTDRLTRDAE